MKKNYVFAFLLSSFLGLAQTEDVSPNLSHPSNNSLLVNNTNSSILTTSFLYDISTAIGAPGNAGVAFVNNEFWVSAWASNNIHLLDSSGAFSSTFQVAGLTGTRSMTTDGTYVYCGTAGSTIYRINPVTKTLVNTIAVSSSVTARFCTYDPTLDGGNGGFWIANFNTDIASISMTGTQLSLIPAATHGLTGMYGAAVYNNNGNHYLFVYHQGGANNDQITVLNLATGLQTGDTYDFFVNDSQPAGATSSLAGGMFLSSSVVSGQDTLIGVSQATPNNLLFGMNVDTVLATDSFKSSNFVVYPNPATDYLSFSTKNNVKIKQLRVVDVLGQLVIDKPNFTHSKIDISNLNSGIYFVSLFDENNQSQTIKVIKK